MGLKSEIMTAWNDGLPVSVIAKNHKLTVKETKELLGNQYTKLNNHYHYVAYRDQQRQSEIEEWLTTDFNQSELQEAVNQGKLSGYLNQCAKQLKVSASAVRTAIINCKGPLPKPSRQEKPYKIGAKSTMHGRDAEIVQAFLQGQAKEAIAERYRVSVRTVTRVLKAKLTTDELASTGIERQIKAHGYELETLIDQRKMGTWTAFTKQEAKRFNVNAHYFDKKIRELNPAINSYHRVKQTSKPKANRRGLTSADQMVIVNMYMDELMTIHEIAKAVKHGDRMIKKVLTKQHVLGLRDLERKEAMYRKRGLAISKANAGNPAIKNQHDHQRLVTAQVPNDYLTAMPNWAWEFVERQPALDLVSKLMAVFQSSEKTAEFLKLASAHLGAKLSYSGINEIIPPIAGVGNWNSLISLQPPTKEVVEASGTMSSYEIMVSDALNQLKIDYQYRNRKLIGKELDFYVPSRKLAIEVSPLWTHNSNLANKVGYAPYSKDASYHQHKSLACRRLGIRLLTLFEKDLTVEHWEQSTKPLLRMLVTGKAPVTMYARETEIKPIATQQAKTFIIENHLDGYVNARDKYGFYGKHSGELLGVFTLGLPTVKNYKKQGLIELKRLAWRRDVQIRYGVSKMLSFIKNNYDKRFKGLMTYSSNNLGWGEGYEKAGFELQKECQPKLTFINPKDPADTYSWQVATPWGAKQGVIAKELGKQAVTTEQARKIVETQLPHRSDRGTGYVAQYDCGSRLWLASLT